MRVRRFVLTIALVTALVSGPTVRADLKSIDATERLHRSSRCPLIPSMRSSLFEEKHREHSPNSRQGISADEFVVIRLSRAAEVLNILPDARIDERLIRPVLRPN
jgi:hypothetical protein